MREIKFRAMWKDTKKWVKDFNKEYTIDSCNDDCFIVMQYTGLKDRNGKEIYEGDVVRAVDWGQKERWSGVVKWQVTGFVITYKNLKNTTWTELTQLADGNCDVWEVIGNIYENQELLKKI